MQLFEELDSGIIEGGRQCGKSNFFTFFNVLLLTNKDMKLLQNIHINFPHTHLNSQSSFEFMNQIKSIMQNRFDNHDYHPTFVGIDEMQIIVPAQEWKKCAEMRNIGRRLLK